MLLRSTPYVLAFLLGWTVTTTSVAEDELEANHVSLAFNPEMLEQQLFSGKPASNRDESVSLHETIVSSDIDILREKSFFVRSVGLGSGVAVSFDGLIGRRLEQVTAYDLSNQNAGFRLRVQADFQSEFFGFSSWDATTHWLSGDTFGFVQQSEYFNAYDVALFPLGEPLEVRTVDRWETRGEQPFGSAQWNVHRNLNGATANRKGRITQILGVRYIYNAENYDTVQYASETTFYILEELANQTASRPFNGLDLTNHMLGLQLGYGGQWSADRFQFSARLVAGLMGNYASSDGWDLALNPNIQSSPTVQQSPAVRREYSDDSFRLSSLVEMDMSIAYVFRDNINLSLGAYAIHLTGQGIGNTVDVFDSSDDLALVGLHVGATYQR